MGNAIGFKAPEHAVTYGRANTSLREEEDQSAPQAHSQGRKSYVRKIMCKEAVRGTAAYNDREDHVVSAFSRWDTSGNGRIQLSELKRVIDKLGLKVEPEVIRTILDEMDTGRDGSICVDGFLKWVLEPPSLKQYFDLVQELYDDLTERLGSLTHLLQNETGGDFQLDQAEQDVVVARIRKRAERELTPLISKLFDFHDADSNGFLDNEESIIMFGNFVDQLYDKPESAEAFVGLAEGTSFGRVLRRVCERSLKHASFSGRDIPPHALLTIQAEVKVEINSQRRALSSDDERQKRNFANAFRILDKNKNHELERDEVMSCLLPSSESQNRAFMVALGIWPTDAMLEKLAKRKTEEVLKKMSTPMQAGLLEKAQDQWTAATSLRPK